MAAGERNDEDADARRKPVQKPAGIGAVRPHAGRPVVYRAGLAGLPEVRALLRDEPVPDWRAPTLATLTDKRFSDPRWIFERKFDGMRCLAFRDGDRVRLLVAKSSAAQRNLPRARRCARRPAHHAIRRGRRGRRVRGTAYQLRPAAGATGHHRPRSRRGRRESPSSTTCSTCCISTASPPPIAADLA